MQTRRDYLVSLGLAKPGRGKFSNDAKQALVKARAEGVKFSDDDAPVKSAPVSLVKGDAPVKETTAPKSEAGMTPYLTPDEYRFPEREYRGITFDNGKRKEVSLRECCNTCRVSLVNHMCDSPTILAGISVKIERR